MFRLTAILAISLVALTSVTRAADNDAGDYPRRPIRFIVPFPPGGANDIAARLVGPRLGERLGQSIVVDNRAGASGNIGVELAVSAPPDGYTFLVGNATTNGINPTLFAATMRVRPAQDLTGVSLLAAMPHALISSGKLPPNSFQELIAYIKARPGEINYSAPLGAHPHLDMLALAAATGINIVHLPSKGAGDAIPMLLRGEAQLSSTTVASVIGQLRAGQLKAYAVTAAQRIAELPNVPTYSEVGLKGVGSINWVGIFAPAATPRAVIDKMHAAVLVVMNQQETRDLFASRLVPPAVSATPAEFNAFVQSEVRRWSGIVKANNVKLE